MKIAMRWWGAEPFLIKDQLLRFQSRFQKSVVTLWRVTAILPIGY